jgi:hypothetical protein
MASRRNFLTKMLLLSGAGLGANFGFGFGDSQAQAATLDPGRRFVFLYVPGGWDQLLFLDPRDEQGDIDKTAIDPAYGAFKDPLGGGPHFTGDVYRPLPGSPNFSFGPGVVRTTAPGSGVPTDDPTLVSLAAAGVPMAIVRGINMGTLGHEPALAYFLTGQPAQGSAGVGSSVSIRLAAQGDGQTYKNPALVPVLSLGIESYTGDKPGKYAAFQMENISDAQRLLRREASLVQGASAEAAIDAWRKSKLASSKGLALQLLQSQRQAQDMLTANVSDHFDLFTSMSPDVVELRGRFGITNDSDPFSADVIAAFAAQTVKQSLAQFLSIRMPVFVDTHGADDRGHAQGAWPALRAISLFIDDLRQSQAPSGGSWLDQTTVVVFSEFARSGLFNVDGGRDHHFVNSCLLAGAGVRAGTVVGATSVVGGMQPVPYDFDSGKLLADDFSSFTTTQRHIKPEDIGASLLASAGASWKELRDSHPLWSALTRDPFMP